MLRGEGMRIGIATDLGHATTLVRQQLRGCEVLMLESNHDEAMLRHLIWCNGMWALRVTGDTRDYGAATVQFTGRWQTD